ncbi:MAG TPA: deoxyguanosinetriphosphate triphosphohydrolase [Bryobacteraceae bacterium]|jgi:dGTPase|nr:deoxyguanosinetriphosphate triphosphohydrolase [Bryobacteraceae bacterium]
MLGRLRLGPHNLRGRRFPEPSHPYRNDFQRDRDRVIHSRAFRRLEGKTQVFARGLYDHFRNRLTHTIEVSQVARTVAATLQLNEEYTETLALAHDLGHPPFGHVGEQELDRQMRRFGGSFEHNRHALRIVDVLEQRYARFDGLNLSFEVREGIVKHSREVEADAEAELQEFLPGQRPPLEAQILDLADEIAYNSADLDDAFSAGLLSMEQLREEVPVFAQFAEQVETQYPGAGDRVRFWEIQRQLMNFLIGGLIEETARAAEGAGAASVEDVRALSYRLVQLTPETAHTNRQVRTLLVNRVYSCPQLLEERAGAVTKMSELFAFLLENPEHIPGYREDPNGGPVQRVVCDYIAGMTDSYLTRRHRELLGRELTG